MNLTLLKSSLYNFIDDVQFKKDKKWYQLSGQTWRNNLFFWASIIIIASIYCYIHGYITQDPATSLFHSLTWAITRWFVFGTFFPLFIAYLVYIKQTYVQNLKTSVVLLALFLFALLLVTTLSAFLSAHFKIVSFEIQGISSMVYRDFSVKLTLLLFSLIAYIIILSKSPHDIKQKTTLSENVKSKFDYIWVMDGQKKRKIKISEICWVKTSGNYLEVHTEDNDKTYLLRKTLKSFKAELSESQFVQIHRSIMVNRNKIVTLINKPTGEAIMTLDNQVSLTVSKTYRPHLTMIS